MNNHPLAKNAPRLGAQIHALINPLFDVFELLDCISDGFFAVDCEFRFLYVNRRFEQLLRRTRKECLGRSLWDCFPALLGSVYEDYFNEACNRKTHVYFERFAPTLNCWYEVDVHPSDKGLSVFFRDISEKKRTEAALQLSNERFRLAAKTDAIYDWDIVANKLYWGEGLFENFGYTSQELQMGQWEATLHPADRKLLVHGLTATLNDPAASEWKREYRLRCKDGTYCFVFERGHILRNDEGHAVRMVGLMRNITPRKQLEQQVERQRRQMTAAVIKAQEQERSQIGRELHDNVNPVLTTVKLYQDLIASDLGNREELVKKSTELLQQCINDIRCLSHRLSIPTLGEMNLRDSVAELLENVAATNQFELVEEIEALDNLELCEDYHLGVFRMLQEQLTNILKYAEATRVVVRFSVEGGNLTFLVEDDGKGFDPAETRTGIGLTNIRVRAESLGGRICIQSAPGEGCSLKVVLPLHGNAMPCSKEVDQTAQETVNDSELTAHKV